ncbi:DNA mismatch repair endonuclease MutL [Pseudarcicella sp. GAP-15]|nr:DNA mismatch repair endonuclease MutL [Pseudarcicella sp. GAP-15]
MHNLIKMLPDAIANQIAAGEVVQRPASVVKELMENSIDAGASFVQLIVKEAGKVSIQVIDDGKGMSPQDALMSFERHATSKISKAEDLFAIHTMGFRGEALASIASVAQVELKTKREEDELGSLLRMEASVLKANEQVAAPKGTSILVKNLFYNIPARRNFLKSNPVEMRHILDEFQRIALANPEIKFSLIQNEQETYALPVEKLGKRIVDLFGKTYREQLAACEENTNFVSIKGYVGRPEYSKKTRGEQFFFVNNRFIKSSYLHHAVMSAYERLVPEGTFPFYVLFLTLDPSHIDINVHPTKTEIKFDDERSIYAILQAAIRKTLSLNHLIPSLDFDANVNFRNPSGTSGPSPFSSFSGTNSPRPVQDAWKKLYEGLNDNIEAFERGDVAEPSANLFPQAATTFQSKANTWTADSSSHTNFQVIQILNKFLVVTLSGGMLLIDQKKAYQRILFDQFSENLVKKNGVSQQLLFPQILRINPADTILVEEILTDVTDLGFRLTKDSEEKFWIQGVPAGIGEEDGQNLLEGILEQIKNEASDLGQKHSEKIARILANRAAIRYQAKKLLSEEMSALVEQLFASTNPSYSPNGELISRQLNEMEIGQLIG